MPSHEMPRANASNAEWARWLRAQPVETRIEWVMTHIGSGSRGSLDVAARIGFTKAQARSIVEKTIERADVSTIRDWVGFYVHVAGFAGVVKLLQDWEEHGLGSRARNAAYWLSELEGADRPENKAIRATYAKWVRERHK
jgi:hypothetical protein